MDLVPLKNPGEKDSLKELRVKFGNLAKYLRLSL